MAGDVISRKRDQRQLADSCAIRGHYQHVQRLLLPDETSSLQVAESGEN